MQKTDFRKRDKRLYTATVGQFTLIDVPEVPFLMIDGAGDPNTAPAYGRAVAALYALSYGLKFFGKGRGVDHVVPPLEGLWWADDMGSFRTRDKDSWQWRMMIRQPDWIGQQDFAEVMEGVVARTIRKKEAPTDEETLRRVRLERFGEGLSVQVLHVGPYDDEGPVLEQLHKRFLPENGLLPRGLHHEIYLSDPRKVAPGKLKTILRQPVTRQN